MLLKTNYFSGTWYPGSKKNCQNVINEFKCKTKIINDSNLFYKIGIVPHAGWFFSGQLTFNVIYNLYLKNKKPDHIFIIGGHLSQNDSIYILEECAIDTPFGKLKCKNNIIEKFFCNIPFKYENPESCEPDNTTELQFPFIKFLFDGIPVSVMRFPPNKKIFEIAEKLFDYITKKKSNILVLSSTDLTHYGFRFNFLPAGVGKKAVSWVKNNNDKKILNEAINLNSSNVLKCAINDSSACCGGSFAFGVHLAKLFNLPYGKIIDYFTSYDIAPEPNITDFVGYGGIIF
jgi:AmmeMemoRadiSam system protein B